MKQQILVGLTCICALSRAQIATAQDRALQAGNPIVLKQRLLVIGGYCDAIAISPDGTTAVCAAARWITPNKCIAELWKKVLIWDIVNNKEIQVLTGHEEGLSHAAFSKDGKKVIGVLDTPTGVWKTRVVIWDLRTGRIIASASVAGIALRECRCLSEDGKYLATLDEDGQVLVYDVDAGCKKSFSAKVDMPLRAEISPDGSTVATASFSGDLATDPPGDIPVQVWNIASGKKEAHFELKHNDPRDWSALSLLFSEDGKVLCVSLDQTTHCLSIPQKKSLGVFVFGRTAAITPDGRYALGNYGSSVFSLKSGKRVADLKEPFGHPSVWRLFSGARGIFACNARDDEIRIWELPRDFPEGISLSAPSAEIQEANLLMNILMRELKNIFRQPKQPMPVEERATLKIQERAHWETSILVGRMAFSPDSAKLVTAAPRYIDLGNPGEGEEAWRKVAIWNLADRTIARQLKGHDDCVQRLAFSRDGKKVIGAVHKCVSIRRTDTEIIVWDAASGDVAKRFTVEGESYGLSQSGEVLLTALRRTGQVVAYDLAKEGKMIFSTALRGCFLSPDGRLAATLKNNFVQVWDLATGKEHMNISLPGDDFFLDSPTLFFSQDGTVLGARGQFIANSTYCWSLAEKKMIGQFAFAGAALSPNGKYLLGTRGDYIALVSLKSQKRVAELEFKGEKWRGSSFLFSPDGSSVVVAGDKTIRIWDLPKNLPE